MQAMFLRCLISFLFACPGFLRAEVRELWHTALTNDVTPLVFHGLQDAEVDIEGNTIVGGAILDAVGGSASAFLAKFDSHGNKLWKFLPSTNRTSGIENFTVDSRGNVLLTVRLEPIRDPRLLTLMKVSAEGNELWRRIEYEIAEGSSPFPGPSVVKVDSSGNIFLMAFSLHETEESIIHQQFVAKFDPQGKPLWHTILPGEGYLFPATTTGISKSFAVSEKGDSVIAGTYAQGMLSSNSPDVTGFVARLDSNGQLKWWTSEYKGQQKPMFYNSVLISPKGSISASISVGVRSTVFSASGKPLHTGQYGGEAVGLTAEGGFLLKNQDFLIALNATGGNQRWGMQPRQIYPVWGIVSDGAGGWLAAGRSRTFPPGIGFTNIDENGNEVWSDTLPGESNSSHQVFLRSTDGSFRIVLMNFSGIEITAFRMDGPSRPDK